MFVHLRTILRYFFTFIFIHYMNSKEINVVKKNKIDIELVASHKIIQIGKNSGN